MKRGVAGLSVVCTLLLTLSASGDPPAAPSAGRVRLEALQQEFETALRAALRQERDAAAQIRKRYLDGVNALEEKLQVAGSQLSTLTAVHAEKARFEQSGDIPDQALAGQPPALRQLQGDWRSQTAALPRQQAQKIVALTERYLQKLALLQKDLAARSDAAGVAAVKAETDRVLGNNRVREALALLQSAPAASPPAPPTVAAVPPPEAPPPEPAPPAPSAPEPAPPRRPNIGEFTRPEPARPPSSGIRALPASSPAGYDVGRGFSVQENPGKPWSYGWSKKPGDAFHLFTKKVADKSFPAFRSWKLTDLPAVGLNTGQEDIIMAATTLHPGQPVLHPGARGECAVVRWQAPKGGYVTITGKFCGLSGVGQYGVRTTTDVHVFQNKKNLFSSYVNLQGHGNECPFELKSLLQMGDAIYFVVGVGNGTYFSDSTGLDAVLEYRP